MARDMEDGLYALIVNARDRFGDYGLVGMIAFREEKHVLQVEHFLLSCRALGKRIESRMIDALMAEAARRESAEVHLPLRPTGRNEPVAAFLRAHFAKHEHDGVFRLPPHSVCQPDSPPTATTPAGPVAAPDKGAPRPTGTSPPDLWQRIATELATGQGALRAATAAALRPRPEHQSNRFREPSDPLEREVASLFENLLAVSPVGAEDNFFELGGQSVVAAQVLARLAHRHGHRLPLQTLFEHPSPTALARHLAALGPGAVNLPRVVPRDRMEYPLSAAQGRLWFLEKYTPGQRPYHIVCAHHLVGPLDIAGLRRALESLTRRHESLRARFPETAGQASQTFDGPGIELVVHDAATGSSVAGVDAQSVLHAPPVILDLATGPLGRIDLTPMPGNQALLVLTLHHIIADGWSLGVLFHDLSELAAGRPLDPLACQTLDIASQQDARLANGHLEAELSYWRQVLHRPPPALDLPTDFPRPIDRTFNGAIARATLPSTLTSTLENLARTQGTTLFTVLMAGFHAALHRWSGQDDILVGTPVAGRTSEASESLIGCLINTVVIRSRPAGHLPFTSFVESVRESVHGALAHQELPFDRLVEALDLPRHRALSPLFQVMLVLQNTPSGALALPGVTCTPLTVHNGSAKFDLVLDMAPRGDGSHTVTLEYNTDLFRDSTAGQFLSSFLNLLEHASSAPTTPLGRLGLLAPADRARLLDHCNTYRPFPAPAPTLHEWFESIAARFPDRTAVTCQDHHLSYDALNRRANRIAHRLRAAGATAGTIVAVCLDRSTDLVAALLGILKAGAAYLPIDLSYPPERLAFMLEDAAAPILVTHQALSEKLPPHQAQVLRLDDPSTGLLGQPDSNPQPAARADDLCYIIYTSGSTGRPKGCCVAHRNVTRLFSATAAWFRFNQDDVWSLFHSCAFDFSVWELWGALLHGGRLVVVPYFVSRSPDDFHALLVRERVTVLNQTPSAFRQLIAADAACGPPVSGVRGLALRYVIFGGEPLEMRCLQPWFERHGDSHPQLVNMYGITETTVHVTWRPLTARDIQAASVIGVPIPDLRLYILDAHGEPCPPGVPGELYVGGDGVARGYLDRSSLTAQRFLPSPFVPGDRLYRTGDLARFLPGFDIEYLGRADRQVKIRGFRIEPGEIESALLTHPGVREAAVVARDGSSGRRLVAYLVLHPDSAGRSLGAGELGELRAHLRRTLPDYMVPAAWVTLPSFPLTPNGKLDTAALPPPDAEAAVAPITPPPATPTEETLASIWRSVLRRDQIGRYDNFFEAGGDSILSIQVISRARQAGWPLSPRHLFEHQTLAALAECADSMAPTANAQVATAPARGEIPLTPIQRWFVQNKFADPHWWNQAVRLELRRPVTAGRLRDALNVVLAHHDAFRIRCSPCASNQADPPRQWYAPAPGDPFLEVLASIDGLSEAMIRAHRALDIESGPVVGAVVAPDTLFIVAHHMVVDGVSWRFILEDLEAALDGRTLVPSTDSFQDWAHALRTQVSTFDGDRPYWSRFLEPHPPVLPHDADDATGGPAEADVHLSIVEFSATETRALLTEMPARLRARVDEILLTALALALHDLTGALTFRLHTEGHGREDIIGGVDVTRTVGWFTALYPVEIALPHDVDAAAALRAAKEQVRATPHRGLGWGVLGLSEIAAVTPDVVFNYLGQLDSLVAGSNWFRLSSESTPPWHGAKNRRSHSVEIDAFVRDGRLRAEFRLSPTRHREATRRSLGDAFAARVRNLARVSEANTPSDFLMVRLGSAQVQALGPAEDVWPLSPLQDLLADAAAIKGTAALDQWHCRLHGPLDVDIFRRAWECLVVRHPVLRSSLRTISPDQRVAVVFKSDQAPVPPWRIEDWRGRPKDAIEPALHQLRLDERRKHHDPSTAPPLRFTLVRTGEDTWFFLWSAPDWMLDGWSQAVVFRELSALYAEPAAALPPARPYREYLTWLDRRDSKEDASFWRGTLRGFSTPTPLPVDAWGHGRGPRHTTETLIPGKIWTPMTKHARDLAITPTALLMAAWAALLARSSGCDDIVFGAAFSGRPAELPGVEGIVGPCTTNLPVRVRVPDSDPLLALATVVRDTLFTAASYQHVSPMQVQECSDMPWRDRLFDSLVVFQNIETGPSARYLSDKVRITEFDGPVHGDYALTLMATPMEHGLHLQLLSRTDCCSPARAAEILAAFTTILQSDPEQPTLDPGLQCRARPTNTTDTGRASVPPRNPLERTIHAVWVRALGPHIGVEDNFFEAGGHSLLAFRVLAALRAEAGLVVSPADLFQCPTIAALARRMNSSFHSSGPAPETDGPPPSSPSSSRTFDAVKARAARARLALGRP
jgi:amino acid adenylation domain-containing protein/non-ribosomal peptide synthase protein (TIGR01720 family)